jgi:hypothetical protein
MKGVLQMKALFWLMTAVVVCGLIGIASVDARAAEAKPINIGVSVDFSGISAVEGLQEFPAFEMAVKEINSNGGINGRPIKLFVLDNGGDPAKTVGSLKVLKDMDKCMAIYYIVNSAGARGGFLSGRLCLFWTRPVGLRHGLPLRRRRRGRLLQGEP